MVDINADIVGLKELAANRKALSKSFGRSYASHCAPQRHQARGQKGQRIIVAVD